MVSIVITARNYSMYLKECIDSCIAQTIKAKEIIYSDDCSDDDSLNIARALRIKTIKHNKHVGVVQARNDGANSSTGDYLIFVDGDDILDKDYIKNMLEVLDKDTIVVYGIMKSFGLESKLYDFNCERSDLLWKQNYCNTSSLIRKTSFYEAGMWQENDYNTHWDWHLFLRLSRLDKFKKSRALLNYRKHELSNLRKKNQEYKFAFNDVRSNIVRSEVKMTIGLVYSARIENFMPFWMDELIKDISFLNNKPQLIVINNSGLDLHLDNWNNKFSEIKIITGNSEKMNTPDKRQFLSKLLADAYNTILENASGELVHMREDDNTCTDGSFKKLFDYITDVSNNTSAVAGLYLSRHQKRIVGGYYDNEIKLITEKEVELKPMQVDFTGTGCILFWKDICPKYTAETDFKNKSHDWAWSLNLKKIGGKITLLPDAVSRHHLTVERFLVPDLSMDINDTVIPSLTHTRITDRIERSKQCTIIKK